MINNFRLKDLREDQFWSQQQLSDKLGIVRRTYASYETQTNSIPLDVLCSIAKTYDVSVHYICGLTNTKKDYVKTYDYDRDYFRKNLISLRNRHGYSQQQLSKQVNCSRELISEYETGTRKVPIDFLIVLAKIYNLTIDKIIGISR